MTVEEKVYAILSGAAGVTALVPADRIKVPGDWQNLARPYIVHWPLTPDPTYTHSGLCNLRKWLYQVSVFADSYSVASALSLAVRESLGNYTDGLSAFWQGQSYLYEADTGIHHFALTFRIAEDL